MWQVGSKAWGRCQKGPVFLHNRIQSLDSWCPRVGAPGSCLQPSQEDLWGSKCGGLSSDFNFRIRLGWLPLPGLSLRAMTS